jgi:hypothetical protein
MHFDEDLQGDEGVRQWERAVELVESFDTLAANTGLGNHAVRQLIFWDASARAREALRRARARLEDAGDE